MFKLQTYIYSESFNMLFDCIFTLQCISLIFYVIKNYIYIYSCKAEITPLKTEPHL